MIKWFKNVSYSFLGKMAAMLFLMLLDIAAARFLEKDNYAEWVYFFSILTMLFWIGWFGINISTKVHVSKYENNLEQAGCIKSAALLRLAVSVVISIIISIVMPRVAAYLGYPDKYPDLKWLFSIAAILVFLNTFTEFFKEIFMGIEKFNKLFALTVVEYAGYFLFSCIGLFIARRIRLIAYGYLASGIVVSIIGWLFMADIYKMEIWKAKISINRHILPIFKYAIPIALISLGGMILVEMDTFMLGLLSTKENVAIYSIAKNLCSKAAHINYAFTMGVMTSFSVITSEEYLQKKTEFQKAVKINYIITAIVVIGFCLLGQMAINILYGKQYAESGYIIRQLVIYYALFGVSNFYSAFLDYRNKAGARSMWYFSVVIINLILNCMWIPKYGARGAAWATDLSLVPYTIYAIIISYREWKVIERENT